jgi:hypothetical protein
MRRRVHACHMRRRIHACHMRRRIHACHMRRRIHACTVLCGVISLIRFLLSRTPFINNIRIIR